MKTLSWDPVSTPQDLQTALRTLSTEYPLLEKAPADLRLEFKPITTQDRGCRMSRSGDTAVIKYSDLSFALRALGSIWAQPDRSDTITEKTRFKTFGIMLDCSRNAVMKPEHFHGWLRRLALLGYNMAMLYTEDTYKLPGEDYFGLCRGAYSPDELRQIDDYAAKLGIEMIGCIQTLGHLEQILQWEDVYGDITDATRIVLVGKERTYQLIEKMVKNFAEVYRSRRIHIGMDETHGLGRGRYMDLFGYKRSFDIFNEHLSHVVKICQKYNLEPMIWSDMYFRMGSKTGDYYDKKCVIPDDVKAEIPKEAQLVYWDYTHQTEELYYDLITRHRALGFEPFMASGVRTWRVFWYSRNLTEINAGACIRACRKAGLKEILFCLWGDDGGYCDFDSAMAGLTYTAELAYSCEFSEELLAQRFSAVCQGNYKVSQLAGSLDIFESLDEPEFAWPKIWACDVLWDDPMLGIYWHREKLRTPGIWQKAKEHYDRVAEELEKYQTDTTISGDLKHALILARLLSKKIDLRTKLQAAYAARDKSALMALVDEIPEVTDYLKQLDESFRTQWLRRNKPFGLEVLQIRIAGLVRRYRELADRIGELLDGKIDCVDELEESLSTGPDPTAPCRHPFHYHRIATGSAIL